MCWGWKQLYHPTECPPWETFTIYYTRQKWELTLEFESVTNLLGVSGDEFRDALEDEAETEDDYEEFLSFLHEDWGDRD